MKKIIIYFDSMGPAGGVERVISNLANEWCNDFEITIITKDEKEPFYILDKRIKRISLHHPLKFNPNSKLVSLYYLIVNMVVCRGELKKRMKEVEPDYIYCASPQTSFEIAFFLKKYLSKLVISEHASKNAPNILFQLMKKYAYPKAYFLSVPTTMDTEAYLSEGCNAVYIPHLATYVHQKRSSLQNKIVLNVGRFTNDKQQGILLDIWKDIMLKNDLDDWKLILVGKGENEPLLLDIIRKHNLEECVTIISPTEKIEEIYKSASIFAFTSRMEGFGMVLLEAMSFGVPCISFDCPSGTRDIIDTDINGFVINCFNQVEYAEKLTFMMMNNSVIEKMGEQAYLKVENWSKDSILNKWYEIFK